MKRQMHTCTVCRVFFAAKSFKCNNNNNNKNLSFNSKHDHVLFLLAVKHCDDDQDYNMLNNNVLRTEYMMFVEVLAHIVLA